MNSTMVRKSETTGTTEPHQPASQLTMSPTAPETLHVSSVGKYPQMNLEEGEGLREVG